MKMRGLAHSLSFCTAILKTAALLVPRKARACPLSTMLVRTHAVPVPIGYQQSGRTP